MSFKTHVTAPQIDKDVQMELERLDCNAAKVYIIWTRVFDQDCQLTTLCRYLRRHYQWAPGYQTLREKVMPRIITVKQEIETKRPCPDEV